MPAEFSAEEENRLRPFFTNLDRSTFGLKLPQEVAGALFSRYSRSTKSLRRTFLDEFLGDPELGLKDLLGGNTAASDDSAALKKARAFYDRVLVGYGDDSVAQLGGAHLACENISNVTAKLLEDAGIGETIADAENPRALEVSPRDFYDDRFVRELEDSGYIRSLSR